MPVLARTRQQTRAEASTSAQPRPQVSYAIENTENVKENSPLDLNFIKSSSRTHSWHWNSEDKSDRCLVENDKLEVCFHPELSESTAAIRGSRPFVRNGNYYLWEITIQNKVYGTSVMFGLCTKDQILHSNDYCNLIGLDKFGWSLSHKGNLYHNGLRKSQFSAVFPQDQPVTVSLLFETMRGQLSYFVNGKYLGVAFSELNNVNSELYPVVASTAKCTRMRLTGAYSGYELNVSLLARSCFTLLKSTRDKSKLLEHLYKCKVPTTLINYIW